jgi:hypothetical protein
MSIDVTNYDEDQWHGNRRCYLLATLRLYKIARAFVRLDHVYSFVLTFGVVRATQGVFSCDSDLAATKRSC